MQIETTGWERLPGRIHVAGRAWTTYEVFLTNGYYHAIGDMRPTGPLGLNYFDGNRDTCAVVFGVGADRIALYWPKGRRDAMACFVNGQPTSGRGYIYDTLSVTDPVLRAYVEQAMADLTAFGSHISAS